MFSSLQFGVDLAKRHVQRLSSVSASFPMSVLLRLIKIRANKSSNVRKSIHSLRSRATRMGFEFSNQQELMMLNLTKEM